MNRNNNNSNNRANLSGTVKGAISCYLSASYLVTFLNGIYSRWEQKNPQVSI